MKIFHHLPVLAFVALFGTTLAHADTVTVNATDVIYAAGSSSLQTTDSTGTFPGAISVGSSTSYTFSVTGTISLNSQGNFNNADGVGAGTSSSSNNGADSISGISAPNAGYLVGVFLTTGGPSGSTPTALSYATTTFGSSSPELDQVFFIGDGLTGNGTGSTQTFFVPTGATELYLGISDACGYSGNPSCYSDNSGTFSVDYTPSNSSPSPIPEPSSLALFATGALGVLGTVRRRLKA